jgi:signal peptidase II
MLVLLLGVAVAVLDQITKDRVMTVFFPGESVAIVPGSFDLVYVRNTGAAWGMFGGSNGWLALFSVLMLITIVVFRRSFLNDTITHKVAFGLMAGGIVGNLIDRVRLHYVVDFLDFYWKTHHFPAFNVADSAICIGVGLYMITAFMTSAHPLRDMGANGSTGNN